MGKIPKVAEVSNETPREPPTITERSSFTEILKYLEFKFSDKITNSKVWSLALDIIKEQEIDGAILFKVNESEDDLVHKLIQRYDIPPAPAELIATHIHELKELNEYPDKW